MNAFLALTLVLAAPPPADGLRVPEGFEVSEYAGNALANDITCMTVDPKGRIVVAGRGYIRILVDTKGTGVADKAIDFTSDVKDAAHGLLWEKDTLFAVVDGGLRRFKVDASGDKAAGPSEIIRKLKTGGEHDAHALRRGPDGWMYLLCGNSAKIDKSYASAPTSIIREPVAGCVVRFSPDFKYSEIVADGFRNPYGFDFDAHGRLFTFDSDNERCVSLPWYEPTRVYHVIPGGHYGWRNPQFTDTWRLPPYFPDVVAPIATLGRGSPTGVAIYPGGSWPERFLDGVFFLDWTFGRVFFVGLTWRDNGFQAKSEIFLETTGNAGFAPTAAVFAGDQMYVSIGGRGTRGAVYRIGPTKLSRRGVMYLKSVVRKLEWQDDDLNELLRLAVSVHDASALIDLWRHRDRFPRKTIGEVIRANWDSEDRAIFPATYRLVTILGGAEQTALQKAAVTPRQKLVVGFGRVETDPAAAREIGLTVLANAMPRHQLDAVRLCQLALGDLTSTAAKSTVWEGYTPRRHLPAERLSDLRKALRDTFPSGDANLDRELSRTLAMLEDDDPATLRKILAKITADSDPVEDIHYLIVLARLRGPRNAEQTQATSTALLALDKKIVTRKLNRDRNWPLRLAETHAELARKDLRLNDAILSHKEFGRPDHVLWTRCPGFAKQMAAERFVMAAQRDHSFAWNAELVALMGKLPTETQVPLLRQLWERGGLEDAILPLLARAPQPADAERLLRGLNSPRLVIVQVCLDALAKVAPKNQGAILFALVRGMRLLPDGREGDVLRRRFGEVLENMSGQKLGLDKQKWADWLAKSYPEYAARLGGPDGVDVVAWNKRLAGVVWSNGNAERGRAVFTKASCATCHGGSQALGPDLNGVTGRFSRADLFTAIVQPSKDISPRYRTTQIETNDGKTFQGLIIYEAVDGVILQTGPAETIRIAGDKIETSRVTDISLMPAGLLDTVADGDLADLYAYLLQLGRK